MSTNSEDTRFALDSLISIFIDEFYFLKEYITKNRVKKEVKPKNNTPTIPAIFLRINNHKEGINKDKLPRNNKQLINFPIDCPMFLIELRILLVSFSLVTTSLCLIILLTLTEYQIVSSKNENKRYNFIMKDSKNNKTIPVKIIR